MPGDWSVSRSRSAEAAPRRSVRGEAPGVAARAQRQEQAAAETGVSEDTARLSIGIEQIDDLIADPEQALAEVLKPRRSLSTTTIAGPRAIPSRAIG